MANPYPKSYLMTAGPTPLPPPAEPAIGGDDGLALGVVDAVDEQVGLNPPNATEWGAPRRAQASMATGSSGTIGM